MASTTNKGYDPNIQEKANSPLATALRRFAKDSNALAKYLGCSVQAINQYKQGMAFPKTENLIKIAEYYGISIDYLLGLTGVPNRDTSIQSVHDVTGLSVGAVYKLHDMSEKNAETSFVDIISALIEDDNAEFFLRIIKSLVDCINTDRENELINISIDGVPLNLFKGTHLKLLLQTRLIENIPTIAKKVKERDE